MIVSCHFICFLLILIDYLSLNFVLRGVLATNANSNNGDAETIESWKKLDLKDEHLLHASVQGKIDEIQKAIMAGGNINVRDGSAGNTALMWACFNGHIDAVKYLISKGAKINTISRDKNKTPLLMGVYSGRYDIVEYLIIKGAKINYPNKRKDTAIALAAYLGNQGMVATLLQYNPDLEIKNSELGFTALHISVMAGHEGISKKLIKAGADVDAIDNEGNSAFILASRSCHPDLLVLLANSGADPDLLNDQGFSSLMIAVSKNHLSCVNTILEMEPLLELKNQNGETALMVAAKLGSEDIVQALLWAGSNVRATNPEGKPAKTIAKELGHTLIHGILQDFEDIMVLPPL